MLILIYLSVLRCKMLKIQSNISGIPDFYTSPYLVRKTVSIGFAPFPQEVIVEDECKTFLDDDYVSLDTKWRSTIVLQIIGVAVGILICVVKLFSLCCRAWSTNFYRMTGCVWIFICTLFTGLSFLILDSKLCKDNPVLKEMGIQDLYENDCRIASGSIMLIMGITGCFLTGVVSCLIKGNDEPRKEKEKKKQEDEKDEEEPTSKKGSEPEEPVEELEPEPEEPEKEREAEPEPEPEPEPVEEPTTDPVEEPEPAAEEPRVPEKETYYDETAEELKNSTDTKITGSGVWIAD
jgi:hypothetical protein